MHFTLVGEVGYVRQSVNLILTRYDGSEMQSINQSSLKFVDATDFIDWLCLNLVRFLKEMYYVKSKLCVFFGRAHLEGYSTTLKGF